MRTRDILRYEWLHFTRNRLKVVAVCMFTFAAIYGLQNGLELYTQQTDEIRQIALAKDDAFQQVSTWLEEGKKGPDDRSYVDISKPLWAFYYLPSWTWKEPSPMMVYSIGQAEQYGYYMNVSEWSTVFDSDLSEEIANPERLAMGALDFTFVLVYLGPLLLLILMFNVKGFETERDILKLVSTQVTSMKKWMILRLLFYLILVIVVVTLLMVAYGLVMNTMNTGTFLVYLGSAIAYLAVWTVVYSLIIGQNTKSATNAVKMIGLWLVFCLIIPASVEKAASIKFPAGYMTEFLDAQRDEVYELYDLYDLSPERMKAELVNVESEFSETLAAQDSIVPDGLLSNSMPYLANKLTRPAAVEIAETSEAKNRFIAGSYWFNPTAFMLNRLNSLCGTDFYAYLEFRTEIQEMIDYRARARAMDSWNNISLDEARINEYMNSFSQEQVP